MKIQTVSVQRFRYRSHTVRDSEGHGHPGPEHDAVQSLLTITTDDGATGRCFGAVNEGAIAQIVTPMLIGEDPFYRERIWNGLKERQRLNLSSLPDRVLTAIDLALWDLAGQVPGQPAHSLPARAGSPGSRSTVCSARHGTRCPPTPARWSAMISKAVWTHPSRTFVLPSN